MWLQKAKLLALLPLLSATYCANTLLTAEGYPGRPPGGAPAQSSTTTDLGNGLFETHIDASSYANWVYYDFAVKDQVTVVDPTTDANWDLAFKRFMIKLNGGVSGNAGVSAVYLPGDNFAARTQAPSPFAPELVDVADAGDPNDACRPTTAGVLFALLNSTVTPNACWFSYSIGVLTPRDTVYVIKTPGPKYFKLKILSYYSASGTSGRYRFQWGEVTPP